MVSIVQQRNMWDIANQNKSNILEFILSVKHFVLTGTTRL